MKTLLSSVALLALMAAAGPAGAQDVGPAAGPTVAPTAPHGSSATTPPHSAASGSLPQSGATSGSSSDQSGMSGSSEDQGTAADQDTAQDQGTAAAETPHHRSYSRNEAAENAREAKITQKLNEQELKRVEAANAGNNGGPTSGSSSSVQGSTASDNAAIGEDSGPSGSDQGSTANGNAVSPGSGSSTYHPPAAPNERPSGTNGNNVLPPAANAGSGSSSGNTYNPPAAPNERPTGTNQPAGGIQGGQ